MEDEGRRVDGDAATALTWIVRYASTEGGGYRTGEIRIRERGAMEMRDRGFVMRVAGLGVAMGVVLLQQPVEAGERKAAERGMRNAEVGFARRSQVGTGNGERGIQKFTTANLSQGGSMSGAMGGQLVFAPTGPAMTTRKAEPRESEAGAQPKRKTITFFRFNNSKLGEVSVQPVVGGVNGAQVSVGF